MCAPALPRVCPRSSTCGHVCSWPRLAPVLLALEGIPPVAKGIPPVLLASARATRPLAFTLPLALPSRFHAKWKKLHEQYGRQIARVLEECAGQDAEERRLGRITALQSTYRSVLLSTYEGEDCLFGPVVNPPDRLLLEVSAMYRVTYQAARGRQASAPPTSERASSISRAGHWMRHEGSFAVPTARSCPRPTPRSIC